VDHYGLEAAAIKAKEQDAKILPVFIFTPEQATEKNPLKSANSVQFMIQSLKELGVALRQKDTRLLLLYGDTIDTLKALKDELKRSNHEVIGLAETKDYTPYAKKRESDLRSMCKEYNITFTTEHDIYLTEPGTILTGTGKIYQKFTPYYEAAKKLRIPHPNGTAVSATTLFKPKTTAYNNEMTINAAYKKFLPKGINNLIAVKGGRTEGLYLLKKIPINYDDIRDYPAHKSSQLSAHNHFGTVSIREVYWSAKELSPVRLDGFLRQLFWRDFHGALMDNFEDLYGVDPYEFEGASGRKGGEGKEEKAAFNAWKKGETGHPLVDAGMKQLLATGYMHNRVRLVVASYLVKDKHVFWRWGERFFAQHLVDYDPAQNMMNWINVS